MSLFIGSVGLTALVSLPGLVAGPSLDAAVFGVVGWRLSQGATLYAGIWDHKPPGAYVLPTLIELLPGRPDPWVVTWIAWAVAWGLVAVACGRLAARMGGARLALPIALLTAAAGGQYLLSLGGGLTEPLATLAAVAALLVVLRSDSWPAWGGAGAVLAFGALVSIQVAPAALALLVLALIPARRGAAGRLAVAALGGASIVAAALAAVLIGSGFTAVRDALLTYNAAYRSAAGGAAAYSVVPWAVLALLAYLALAAVGILALRRTRAPRALPLAALAWLAAGLLMVVAQGRFYAHYVIPLLVPFAILGAVGLADVSERALHLPAARRLALTAGVVLLAISVLAGVAGGAQEYRTWSAANDRARAVAAAAHDLAPAGESMLVWGDRPYLYRLADRSPAIRYPYLLPLTTPGYATPELIASLRDQLEADPPAIVVDAGSAAVGESGAPPLLLDRPTASEGRDLDLLEPLRQFVADHYRLAAIVDGWPVYALQPGGAPS